MVSRFSTLPGNPVLSAAHQPPPPQRQLRAPQNPRLVGIARLLKLSQMMQEAAGSVPVVGVGFSYLRIAGPHAAAAVAKNGAFQIAGFGRLSFANPNFANDILQKGRLEPNEVCTACSGCTEVDACWTHYRLYCPG